MPVYGLLGVNIYIPDLNDIVLAVVTPLTGFISNSISGLVSTLSSYFNNVTNSIVPYFSSVLSQLKTFMSGPLDFIQNTVSGIPSTLSNLWTSLTTGLSGLLGSVSSILGALSSQLSAGISSVVDSTARGLLSLEGSFIGALNSAWAALEAGVNTVGAQLSGAVEAAESGILTAFDGMGNALSGIIGGVFSGFGSINVNEVLGSAVGAGAQFNNALIRLGLFHSPITPEQAASFVEPFVIQVEGAAMGLHTANIIAEAASLGQIDISIEECWNYPHTKAAMQLATELSSMSLTEGLMPAYKRAILASYVPLIPDFNSLMAIYVKEGYLPDHWVEMPAEMAQNFAELGFSLEWAQKLWGQHWQYPSATQLYEMLHRTAGNFPEIGVTTEVLREMLKLHDYEPRWRAQLEALSWNTWRIFDIRTAWEMELVDDEGLEKRLIDTGYEPEDAKLVGAVQKMFVLRSEIDALAKESETDFINGWISRAQLEANYKNTPYNANIIALRLAAVELKRERTDRQDTKTALANRYLKGDLSETEYKQELSKIGVTQDRISIEAEKVNAQKLKTVKEETTIVSKALTEATYSRAYKLGLIPEEDYRSKLAGLKYGDEDVDLLVQIYSPEKPTSAEIPTLTLGELKGAFRAEVLTEEDLRTELNNRRYTTENIETIVATEKTKIKAPAGPAGIAG